MANRKRNHFEGSPVSGHSETNFVMLHVDGGCIVPKKFKAGRVSARTGGGDTVTSQDEDVPVSTLGEGSQG